MKGEGEVGGVMAAKRYRRRCQNIAADPRVSVLICQRDAPQHYVHVQGTATGTPDGARDLIERLAQAYTGAPHAGDEDDQRVLIRVAPDQVRVR
jgi:general stress protein 26